MFLVSFYGQSASDNPLGVDRALAAMRPQTTRYWSVADGSVAIPEVLRPYIGGLDVIALPHAA